jgi:hypothetical protein
MDPLARSWANEGRSSPRQDPVELDTTTGVSGSPDILEFDDGAFAVIGVDITD